MWYFETKSSPFDISTYKYWILLTLAYIYIFYQLWKQSSDM